MSTSALKVQLDKIGPEGYELDTRLEVSWLIELMNATKAPYEPRGPGRLAVRLDRAGDVVHVRGRVSASLSTPCGRCLEPLSYELNVPLEVAMFPAGSEPAAGPEGDLEADDLGVSTYEKKEIDLTAVVRDEIFLEMPMNPVCVDNSNCEALLASVAKAAQDPVDDKKPGSDPRWAALKSIKLS